MGPMCIVSLRIEDSGVQYSRLFARYVATHLGHSHTAVCKVSCQHWHLPGHMSCCELGSTL